MHIEMLAAIDYDAFYTYVSKLYQELNKNNDSKGLQRLRVATDLVSIRCSNCKKFIIILNGQMMKDAKCKCGMIYAWIKYNREDDGAEEFTLYEPTLTDKYGNVLVEKRGNREFDDDDDDEKQFSRRKSAFDLIGEDEDEDEE